MKKKYEFKGRQIKDCPTYFAFGVQNIKSGKLEFQGQGYDSPAWHLSIHLYDEFEEDGIEAKELEALVGKKDKAGIIEWFRWYYPRAMDLVPTNQYWSFLKGFWRAVETEKLF